MPIQQIGVGAAPNDGTGDQLRTAFQKVNDNSSWLIDKIGASDTQIQLGANLGNRWIDATGASNLTEDIVFPISTLNPVGIGSPATLVVTSGQSGTQMALRFDTNNTLYVVAEMPHTWIGGTTIFPHVHVQPQTNLANTIVWDCWYQIADLNAVLPADSTTGNFNANIAAGNQWKFIHLEMPSGGFSMIGKTGPSTIIRLKYQVISCTAPFDVLSFDVHARWGGSPVPT